VNRDTYPSRATDVAARMIGGELMIMSGRDSSLFSLNETAAVIWQAANGLTPLSQIVERHLCDRFDVDPVTALHDAEEICAKLAAYGILHTSDGPIDSAACEARS
jgi:hypothetical protein